MDNDCISVAELNCALRAYLPVPPPYHRLYKLVLNGIIPASRGGRGWLIKKADIPSIAEKLSAQNAA